MRLTVDFFDACKCAEDIRVLAMRHDEKNYPVVLALVGRGDKRVQFVIELAIRELLDEDGIVAADIHRAVFSFTEEEILKGISQGSEELSGIVTIEAGSTAITKNCTVRLGKEYSYRIRVKREATELTLLPAKGAPLVLTQDRGGGKYTAEINAE